jgi:hypothetical protein
LFGLHTNLSNYKISSSKHTSFVLTYSERKQLVQRIKQLNWERDNKLKMKIESSREIERGKDDEKKTWRERGERDRERNTNEREREKG